VRGLLRLLPDLAVLLGRLLADPAVPLRAKACLGAAALYLANPVDAIPDFVPLLGVLDDLILVAVVLDGLLNHVDREVLSRHWPGDPQALERSQALARRLAAWVPRRVKAAMFGGAGRV
jgi:uncharacterized membrane protein YkvA (DUF1232 family)